MSAISVCVCSNASRNPHCKAHTVPPTTIRGVQKAVRAMGLQCGYDRTTREYRISRKGGSPDEVYFTNDAKDAILTAGSIVAHMLDNPPAAQVPADIAQAFTVKQCRLTDGSVVWEVYQQGSGQRLASAATEAEAAGLEMDLTMALAKWAARSVHNTVDC